MTSDGPIYAKYRVERNDGRDQPGGDREDAEYFVLDYVHDPFAQEAIEAYADACCETHPTLAGELRERVHRVRRGW